jgi:chromosomal replication initiation ATPase DnaA
MPPRIAQVVRDISAQFNVSVEALLGDRRMKNLSLARHHMWWRIRGMTTANGEQYSLAKIGLIFGVNHTSVLHGVNRIQALLDDAATKQRDYEAQRARMRVAVFNSGVVEEEPLASDYEVV